MEHTAAHRKQPIMATCRYTTAIVLCDQSWRDPDLGLEMGSTILARSRRGMLRLESQILLAQLHIRKRLEVACRVAMPSCLQESRQRGLHDAKAALPCAAARHAYSLVSCCCRSQHIAGRDTLILLLPAVAGACRQAGKSWRRQQAPSQLNMARGACAGAGLPPAEHHLREGGCRGHHTL